MRVLVRTLTKVNVNTAEPRQIAPVLDVTDAVAESVVKRRTSNGNFKTIEDLKQVQGVDPVKLEARKDRIIF
jgi:competence protein ComEA